MTYRNVNDRGFYNVKQKLTPLQWDEINRRRRDGEPARALAAEFGVSRGTIDGRVKL